MNVSFIGAGKVGTAFGQYISNSVNVKYYHSRSKASAEKAADVVGCEVADLRHLVEASDLIFITTSDNAIESVAGAISKLDIVISKKAFVHMSGALTSRELDVLKEKGAQICSLHPLQTFSDIQKAVIDLKTAYFSVEGDKAVVESLVKELGNPYFVLDEQQKNKYHLSACIFSNYLCTLMNLGSRMLEAIGIEEKDGMKAMKPLIEATLSNIYLKGTQASLTGPIQRGDTKTLNRHMSELKGLDLKAYQLLGEMTTKELIMNDDIKNALTALWRENDEE